MLSTLLLLLADPALNRPSESIATVAPRALERVVWDERDGEVYAVGDAWKARFGSDGATFVPFLGSDAPRNFPLALAASHVSVGGVALELVCDVRPTRVGDAIAFARGAAEELFEAQSRGIEHSLRFASLPARGELVVRTPFVTELSPRVEDGGIVFANERGGVRYGAAVAIDARGSRLALAPRIVDGAIQIDVPAEFVRAATLPLVIDPFVEAYSTSTGARDDLAPDVAFTDATGGEYRIDVFETAWSATDHDVTARLTKLADGSSTLYAVDATPEYWAAPKCAAVRAISKLFTYLEIVAEVGLPASGARDVKGRTLQTNAGLLAPVVISAGAGGDNHAPDVGGDPYSGGGPSSFSIFLVVWQRDLAGESDVLARHYAGGPILTVAGDVGVAETRPSISKWNGTTQWCVAWERAAASADRDIWSRRYTFDLSGISAPLALTSGPSDDTVPSVSSGDANYVVAFRRDVGGQRDVMVVFQKGATALPPVDFSLLEGGTHAALDQLVPSVDGDATGYLLAYHETTAPGVARTRLTSFAVDQTSGAITLHETHVPLGGSADSRTQTEIASHAAAFSDTIPRFALAWDERASAGDRDVFGATYVDGTASGTVLATCFGDGSDTACPCGANLGTHAGCPNSLHADGAELQWTGVPDVSSDTLTVRAARLLPSTVGVLVQGSTNLAPAGLYGDGLRCFGGSLVRIAQRTADASGDLAYPSSGDTAISLRGGVPSVGATRVYQLVYRNAVSFCTPATWNTTNALVVAWRP